VLAALLLFLLALSLPACAQPPGVVALFDAGDYPGFLRHLRKFYHIPNNNRDVTTHHIIQQLNIDKSVNGWEEVAKKIHNTDNAVLIDSRVHKRISDYMSKKNEAVTGKGYSSINAWLKTQTFDKQREWGLDILQRALHGLDFP